MPRENSYIHLAQTSSAVDADRIILMEHGRISEQGSHTELIAAGGKYAEMFRAQAEAYNE